jgi:very-short-patch-repair endonuclease
MQEISTTRRRACGVFAPRPRVLLHSFERVLSTDRETGPARAAGGIQGQGMDDMAGLIRSLGGLAATHELYATGHDRRSLAWAVRMGRVFRVRNGWYAAPGTHETLLECARVGGRATCATGLRLHGCWHPSSRGIHVACAAHDSRLRSRRDSRRRLRPEDRVRVHWRPLPATGSRLLLEPLECLRDATHCVPPLELVVAADSVLFQYPELRSQWGAFRESLPTVHRQALAHADGICESGLESVLWHRIRNLPVPVRRQVGIPGVGRVDFVVGQRLVVEVDGESFHSGAVEFERDRQRDAVLTTWGFAVLRFSFRQVMERGDEVDAAIRAALRAGWHLGR